MTEPVQQQPPQQPAPDPAAIAMARQREAVRQQMIARYLQQQRAIAAAQAQREAMRRVQQRRREPQGIVDFLGTAGAAVPGNLSRDFSKGRKRRGFFR